MWRPHCWQYAKPTGVGVPQRGHVIMLLPGAAVTTRGAEPDAGGNMPGAVDGSAPGEPNTFPLAPGGANTPGGGPTGLVGGGGNGAGALGGGVNAGTAICVAAMPGEPPCA